ncbi:MAG: YebC/PmpR family DNA-binding transcriptional regulator [Candidatus Dojkabacteria bacterium]|nr:YebC/PmpR family DNA-binding transcriptional regulator [Candidatus Dojkabacteria bacterium]
MAGHSKWNNIKKTKGANDIKRGKVFSKLSKDIEIATRIGESGDLTFNPTLRVLVDKAKAANMTSDKIQNAINKGLGISSSDEITYENTYELYGPNNIAILVDTETDNTNRTLTEIKTYVHKAGGKMVPEGSISWQFVEMGLIQLKILEGKR